MKYMQINGLNNYLETDLILMLRRLILARAFFRLRNLAVLGLIAAEIEQFIAPTSADTLSAGAVSARIGPRQAQ